MSLRVSPSISILMRNQVTSAYALSRLLTRLPKLLVATSHPPCSIPRVSSVRSLSYLPFRHSNKFNNSFYSSYKQPFYLLSSPLPSTTPSASASTSVGIQKRLLSDFVSILNADDSDIWPRAKNNTFFNVCSKGEIMVIERFGQLHKIQEPGYFFAVPFVDQIKYVIDMRERALVVQPQSAITKDNVHVKVSGNLYCQFVEAEKAAYGCKNPLYAVMQHAQSSMRAAIGEMELDQILHARAQLNQVIRTTVQEAAAAWGIEIKRYEITEVTPDKHISEAMDKQAAAERERRKKVLEAEGDKKSAELQSEGEKIKLKNESEGLMIKIQNEASARKQQLVLEAEGFAESIKIKAQAEADAIKTISEAMSSHSHADNAAVLNLAREYIKMYGDIGQKSNTMIFSDRPADVNSLIAQATAVLQGTQKLAIPTKAPNDQ